MRNVGQTVDSLSIFDKFQGQIISTINAEEIQAAQQEMINECFKRFRCAKSTPIFNKLVDYLSRVDQGIFINNPQNFQQEQDALFHQIHTMNFPDTEKMFYEYLLGLSRLILSVQLLYGFIKYINNDAIPDEIQSSSSELYISESDYSLEIFLDRALVLAQIGKPLISYLSAHYFQEEGNPEKYWNEVEHYFRQHPQLDILARNLVSIQYIPENKRFLAMMQSIHWQGFGGSGDILLKYDQLKGLAVHAIAHHDNYNIAQTFNRRLLAFKLPLESILGKTQALIIEYLTNNFPTGALNIHDFCSGPRFIAVKSIVEKAQNRTFNLSVSDIDGSSLLSLLKEKNKCGYSNLIQYEVRYEDLSLPSKVTKNQRDKYHLVSVNLGLHQLPINEIYSSIRHFSKITKIGGLISNLDASELRYLQLMVIPGNLVDREGHVPYIEQMDLNQLVTPTEDPEQVRIAYPLIDMSQKAISDLDPNIGVGPYMVAFYTPVIIARKDFDLLEIHWRLKDYKSCEKLIYQYLSQKY